MTAEVSRDPSSAAPDALGGRALEVIVLGAAPSAPQIDGQGSGVLVRAGGDTLLLDCGLGVSSGLLSLMDPRALSAIVITHFHADHFLDLVSLRYHLPWAGVDGARIEVLLPPGGIGRLEILADVISESTDFFARALDLREYDPERPVRIGALTLSFVPTRHYVPGWAVTVATDDGRRVLYTGDTGPSDAVLEAARDVDLLVVEATLGGVHEDVTERGHLTADEALEAFASSGAQRLVVIHRPDELPLPEGVELAYDGLQLDV